MEQLLSEETKVTVQAIQDIPGLGFLDKSKGVAIPSLTTLTQTQLQVDSQHTNDPAEEMTIPAGRRFQIPVWLALSLERNGYVRIVVNEEINKEYSRQFIRKATDVFETDPATVNFSKFPYYFEVGGIISKEIGDVEMAKSLRDMMLLRFRRIYDEACNCSDPTNKFVRALTTTEKDLYQQIVDVNECARVVKTMQKVAIPASSYQDLAKQPGW